MKKHRKLILILAVVLLLIGVGVYFGLKLLKKAPELEKIDTAKATVTLQDGENQFVLQPDHTYNTQGIINIKGFDFAFETDGAWAVEDGALRFPESAPQVHVSSTLGNFDMAGSITATLHDGTWTIQLEGDNGEQIFLLIDLDLSAADAEALGLAN